MGLLGVFETILKEGVEIAGSHALLAITGVVWVRLLIFKFDGSGLVVKL